MKEKVSELKADVIEVYSDGACSPNPGRGGYGYVIRLMDNDRLSQEPKADALILTSSRGYFQTTNNRMELMGCFAGLAGLIGLLGQAYRSDPEVKLALPFRQVNVISDSSYLCRGFSRGWVKAWKLKGWRTSTGAPVKNVDLWQGIDALLDILGQEFQLSHHFICVPGHRNYKYNEICDKLAVKARSLPVNELLASDEVSLPGSK